MSEGGASTYGELIEEAFIRPIRSVVVVDDEFPTLDGLLDRTPGALSPPSAEDVQSVRDIIRVCHGDDRRWMVEVHDGLPDKETTTAHITQADLMILDFHLDRGRPNDPTKAINILRRLDGNDYFNLVIVYTKGDEQAGGDIARVVREIGIGLCTEDERLWYQGPGFEKTVKDLQDWEESENGNEHIRRDMLDAIDDWTFLRIRTLDDIDWKDVCNWPEMQDLKRLVEEAPRSVKSKMKSFAKWALHEKQLALKNRMAQKEYTTLSLSPNPNNGTNWIRTDRIFVTVANKRGGASLLPQKLLTALADWRPEPHRLLMSKMRAVLDERGVLAEQEVLGNKCLQVGWLKEYLSEDANNRPWSTHNAITRHWEGLGDAIREEIMGFAGRLGEFLISQDPGELVSRWYRSLDPLDVSRHINRYACSKPVSGGHLATGHVLRFTDTKEIDQFWLCLTPACDLEPCRPRPGWPGRLGSHLPFIAVELYRANLQEALDRANAGNHLFLDVDEEILVFSFTPSPRKGGTAESEATPSPKWEQMFAAAQGVFYGPDGRSLTILRAAEEEVTDENEEKRPQLMLCSCSASVVAQLRYEYALNLLHRLGATLSRVGVGFVSMSTLFPANG